MLRVSSHWRAAGNGDWKGAFPFDQKSLLNDTAPLFAAWRICQYRNTSSLVGCDANCSYDAAVQYTLLVSV
ncbi:hypothetical protein F2P81_014081 [Scophthalmus maximus]|uniref:Uncharacterized protein n=1 Tax=Scophthalmus maximus TaxID=52904 RepID=A0A6A4SN72_SCOMX|nr:hypothetical protein F2P81_014081 [Scophthalmus maximus]